jgi:hypothetical protein
VCCPDIDGIEQRQFIEAFEYTETKLLSIQRHTKYSGLKMKSQGWKNFDGANPYLEQPFDNHLFP